MIELFEIALWWLAIEVLGMAALPITSSMCQGLHDRGYAITRLVGLLLLTYVSWILAQLGAGYSYTTVAISFIIIALCSAALIRIKGTGSFKIDRRLILTTALLYTFAFFLLALIRAYSPDIYWSGGEKFMDMAFINALLRSPTLPPMDPWLSGLSINYYYFGHLMVADLVLLTGVKSSIAFNLATASFFALSLAGAFGIGYNLTRRHAAGYVTALFVTIAGNLVSLLQVVALVFPGTSPMLGFPEITSFSYWTASRVIPHTINEFPFFSFLHADLHAHMISIPFQLAAMAMLLGVLRSGRPHHILNLLALGLSIGFFYPLNSWEYPTYIALTTAIFLLKAREWGYVRATASLFAVLASSYILYYPFHSSFEASRGIAFVTDRTELVYYLLVFGMFLFFMYSFAVVAIREKYLLAVVIVLIPLSLYLDFQLLIVLLPLLFLSSVSLLREKGELRFVYLLVIAGASLSLFSEVFYVEDIFSPLPGYQRMNTVFKIYEQIWLLFAVASGYAAYMVGRDYRTRRPWAVVACSLVLAALVYPPLATYERSGKFAGAPELDGARYISREHQADYGALLFLGNMTGTPVVLSAPGEQYRWTSYVSTFTGLPTVLGWAGHELTWRTDSDEVNRRLNDINTIYRSGDYRETMRLITKYNVTYIYIGEAEHAKYDGITPVFADHPETFKPVYDFLYVKIYEVT
ncbi:MAG TPA: hypothetical protein HA257_10445 [Candidatus Methanoperedenaceae archaeon]|nr:hypothetical protein [Candidatus Methanoperedenaceae archaeon]